MKSYCLLNLLALPLQNATVSIRYAHHAHAIYSILAPIINSQDYRRALIPFKISIDIDIDRQLLFFILFHCWIIGPFTKDFDYHIWSCTKRNWQSTFSWRNSIIDSIIDLSYRLFIYISGLVALCDILLSIVQRWYFSPCSSRTSSVGELPRKLRVVRGTVKFSHMRGCGSRSNFYTL